MKMNEKEKPHNAQLFALARRAELNINNDDARRALDSKIRETVSVEKRIYFLFSQCYEI